ncbi:carbohydrate ABC transporter permease [Gulosibacter sp. 10]|uniref:carbohydrate ABC transporter permease n=1 Tax=Gulosibacter sp. 10 TaxID=1255570 RepID=UPI00097EF89C|nr:sugar ABC transporter permease [Gulosibacter sp. 10]SJM63484.1 N-Acetyl-D-glucosamine ABC transport system, permease protein [Gulosibacter sp. 10]
MTESAPPSGGSAVAEEPRRARPRRGSLRRRPVREALTAYGLVAPALFGVFAFLLLPVLVLVPLSFADWDLLHPLEWVGTANWSAALANPDVWKSFGVTMLFVLMVLPLQVGLGLWLATLLVRNLPGSAVFRTLLVLPWVSAPVVLGVVWRWLLDYDGVVNQLLGEHIGWLTDARFALPVVAFVQAWTQIGYVSLFFMAGLTSIPDATVEAARIDGASDRQIFWRIKLPLLRPTMFFVTVTGMIAAFQAFDLVYTLSPNGGPQGTTDLIAARIYSQAIPFSNLGQAAVLAIMLFVLLVAVALVQNAYFSRRTTYER